MCSESSCCFTSLYICLHGHKPIALYPLAFSNVVMCMLGVIVLFEGTLPQEGGWMETQQSFVFLLSLHVCFHGGKRGLPGQVIKTPHRKGCISSRLGRLVLLGLQYEVFPFSKADLFQIGHNEYGSCF